MKGERERELALQERANLELVVMLTPLTAAANRKRKKKRLQLSKPQKTKKSCIKLEIIRIHKEMKKE